MCCSQSVAGSGHTKQYRYTYPAQFVVMGNTNLTDKRNAAQLMLQSLDTADGHGQGEARVAFSLTRMAVAMTFPGCGAEVHEHKDSMLPGAKMGRQIDSIIILACEG